MPIVAVSPPLIFGGTPSPTPAPVRTPTPVPVRTPRPGGTLTPTATPGPLPGISGFVERHDQFINRVDELNACFRRDELSDFSDQEFFDHSQIAMKDKYIVQEKDVYCSMQGVQALTKTLRRLGEE